MASFESPSISRTERRSPSPLPYPQKRSVSPLYHPQKRSVSPLSHRLASPRHVTHTHFASSSESSSPYYHSFQRAKSLRQLLTELQRKDSELSNLLRAPGARHVPKFIDQGFEGVVGKQALITAYQNFVGSLVSLVAQSVFLEHPDRLSDEDDPHHVVRALHRKTCPDMNIFCRLVTDPATVAGVHPQSDSSKMIKGVPVNQLARFCDVSVLRFLSQVNEHTKPHSILWAIDYTIHLLNTLTNSLLMHSTVGWYGAPSTRKKKVTSIGAPHHSAFPPPIPAPPTVVVVGSPTAHSSHLDPVTGQPSLLGDQTQFQFPPSRTFAQPSHLVAGAHSTGGRLGADIEGRRHQHPPSNLSLEGQIEGARSSPSPTEFTSPSWSSEGSPPTSLRHHEEGLVDRVGSDAVGRELTLMPPPSHLHLDAPRSPRLADIRVSTPQSIPEEDEEDEEEEGERGGGGTEGGQRRWRGPTPEYGSFESEGSKEEEEEEEEVRKKPLGAEEEIPNVDIKKELEVLMNAEGRISLVAILQAIARLPQSEDIWTEKLGTQCFTLIQLCMELGLTQRSRGDESMTMKRRRFQKQENIAFRAHGKEHPSRIHSKYVVHYAIHALIQCGTNLMVGCTHESDQTCCLSYKRLATQKDSIHSKLLRHLKRIHLHSPQDFQQVMMSFASAASIRRVFQFLHVVLQYCQRAPTDNVDTLLLSIVSSVLRILVDRLTQLDLSKPALRSDCLEACLFFQYAQHLFNFPTFTQLDSYRHIHMYIHRIALSVILPADTPPQHSKVDSVLDPSVLPFSSLLEEAGTPQLSESSPTTSQPSPALQMSHKIAQSLPRKLAKQGTSVPTEMDARSRSTVFPQEHGASKSPKAHRRGLFTKQHSIHEDSSPNMDGREVSGYLEEWRGLKMEVLRHRIQRLVVLMDLSEPGTVPDPGMLASLVDLSDGTLVVARAMVLLECALFVHNLRDKENKKPSHWLQVNKDTHNIAMSLKRWAEAIGEKLRVVELRERDMTQQMRAKGAKGSIVLPEEPVLPDVQPVGEREGVVGTKFQTISFGIKMAACVLLYEITHFLRDSPSAPPFSPLSTPRVSVTNLDDRRQSVVSGASTDTEAVLTPTYSPGASLHPSPEKRPPMLGLASSHSGSFDEEVSHDGRSGSFEDEFLSLNVRSPRQKRVSVYLRVNSAVEGGESGRGRLNSALKQTVNVRFASTSNEPSPQRRSSLAAPVSVGRRHVSFHEANRPPRRKRTSAVTTGTLHPIPKKPSIPSSQSFQDYVPDATTPDVPNRPPLLQQASTASQRSINIGSQIQHGISRLRTRAKAFRKIVRRKTATEAPKASQLGASPSLTQKKRPQRSSQGQMFGVEDNKRFFPWLDIVEHLIIVDALNPEAHSRHMRACKELVTSLNHVYQVVEAGEKEAGPGRQTVETLMTRSISTLFAGPWLSFVGGDGTGMSPQQPSRWSMPATLQAKRTSRKMALSPPPRHESAPLTSIHTPSTSNSQQLLGSLDFRSARMGVTDFLTSPLLNQEATIEVFLEEDTAFSKEHCMADFNRSRKKYIQESCAGLMHLPFSLLVYTAPILLTGTFASLKEVAWAMILDSDQSLAQAAGCFFLLAAAKEGDSAMKEFFYHKVEKASHQQQKEAMGRFMALWQFRYKVWPSMEERGQKKFNAEREREEREDQQTIGYSLPANLLGSPGRDVPVAPWTALSVCIHQDCQKNPDKCYRATRLAPLRHRQEVSKSVENFSVSGLSLSQEADSKPTSVYYGVGSEDTAGNININQWEAVEPTLFPPSLLPLIQFVISSLTPHTKHTATSTSSTSDQQSLSISELARQAIWQCMVEDSRLLFRPLLNRFNKLYQDISDKKNKVTHAKFTRSLADILHPIHHILKSFAILPPRAAHFLFNNFVGIITRHTDQPCPYSAEIIESVLSLLTMVVPSVQGLDLKMLKSVLKKESCYTTILTTARIRGAERIQIIDETNMRSGAGIPVTLDVEGDSTFGQLIASFKDVQLSYELLQRLYLVDQSKELPVLSSLVVQDHYSVTSDKQCPTFLLREVGRGPGREVWSSSNQLDQLFVHKMSDILRVLLTVKLLATGPDVEKGFTYNEFAQPNYRFLHQELVALNSFPRKALTSVRYEAGSTSLTQHHLRSADSMLMGTWVKFVLDLFLRAKPDYEWGNSMTLFLNVINGALLLYSEDLSILRRGLASLLIAASKFVPAFKKHGYELVILTLIQTYGSHLNNSLVTGALKFIWGQFYALNLNSNVFLLQAISATAILLSEDAAKLSTSYGTPFFNYLHAQQIDPILAQRNHARAAFELMEALDSETAPPDELDVRSFCPLDQEPWQPLTLQTTFYLCITLASWNPEAIRGMQMLVFLDHLMPMFLKSLSMSHHSNFTSDSVRLLVKGCESITKIILAWDSLGSFLRGVTSCIERNPQLAAHEQIFLKLKALLEVIMNVSSQSRDQEEDPGRGGGGGGRGGGARQRRHLLHSAPTAFCDVVVGLVAQLMLSTRTAPYPRLRYRLSDLLSQKLTIKDAILPKILLPLCIQLGLRDDLQQLPREDTDFLLQLLDKKVENTLKLARHQFHPCHFLDPSRSEIPADMFFRAIKVFSCAFSESFSLQDWSRITQWVHSLSLRKLDIIKAGSQFEQAGHERRGSRQSRHSSVSSVTGHHNLDSYVAFHKALLFHVYESLLSMYHVPLFSFLWPLLGRLEVQLTEAERGIKTENPGQLQGIRSCIDKCQSLRRDGPAPKTTKSKNALLHSYQEEMKTPTQHQFKRASTMVDRKRPKHAIKKRLSYQLSLPSIGEEELRGEVDRKGGSAAKKSIEARPTFLGFSNLPPEETRVKKPAILLRDEEVRKKAKFLTEEQQAKVSTLSSSDTSPSQKPPAVKHFVRKSALKKHTAESNTLSPLNDSPEPSPKFKRKVRRPLHSPKPEKSKRNPPLGRLRDDSKFTSSEIQADVEDFDVGSDTMGVFSPQTEQSLAAGRERSGVSVVNKTAIEMSVPSAAEGGNMLLVEAEVHHDLNSLARSPSPAQQPPSSVVVPSPSLLPPPPPLTDSRSSSPSRTPPSLPSPPPPFHSPPLTFTSPPQTEDPYHTHDLDSSNDLLLPRDRTGSSPPLHVKNSRRVGSPWHEQSPCDNETETDMDTLLPHSSSSSLTRKLSSPTNLKRLSFDRRQSKEKEGVSFKSMQDDSTC